jgi:hypothetical protein
VVNPNYPSASQAIRNLADIRTTFEVLDQIGKFRIVRFEPPFFGGSEFWVVNEKGFLWEPADSLDAIFAYLDSDEAKEYDSTP